MRFLRLTVAVTALSVVIALPAGASAFRHPSPNSRCRIGMEVAPRLITAGDPVVVWGQLVCNRPGAAADKVVRLFHHLRGVPGFTYVQSTTTNANGLYEFENADSPVDTNRLFRVRSHGAQSGNRAIRVEAEVNLSGPAEGTQLYTGRANAVTFTGTVTPADAGALVVLQRQNALTGNEWHGIQRGFVQGNGTFSITHAFRYPGDANIRVLVRSQSRNVPSRSNILAYEISQAQNPTLSINSSADPITFGQMMSISGTLTGGANQMVTLYARTAGRGQHFAPVAQVMCNGEGNYAFPPQAPVNSTFYRVQGAGKHSAVLFEGVRDLLTASVSQMSVPAGQPVTFSGAVAPDHSGGIIYLERKDAHSAGYHVIQVAIIGSGSTYTIEHRFYDAGSKIVRIYVPGDPQNAAAASSPFTIEVTPTPISALTPEASTNTSQSAEGKLSESGGEEATVEGLEEPVRETEKKTREPKSSEEGVPRPGTGRHHHGHR